METYRSLLYPNRIFRELTIDIISEQKKTPAAEAAIKLTVYQQDGGTEEETVEEAVVEKTEASAKSFKDRYKKVEAAAIEETPEPIVRETSKSKSESTTTKDVESVVAKWSKKKG